MSQNVKQSSLQLRRLATPPFCSAILCTPRNPPCLPLLCLLSVLVPAFGCVSLGVFKTELFYLASSGCNRWEMELAEELYMLWMHVDGSP